MATSKGRIISWTIGGKTFESDGDFEIRHKPGAVMSEPLEGEPITHETAADLARAPRSKASIQGTITGVITMTAAEMAAAEKTMTAWVWRLRWSEMWRVVGALAAFDLEHQRKLCEDDYYPKGFVNTWLGVPWPDDSD